MQSLILFFATGFGAGSAAGFFAEKIKTQDCSNLPERWTGAGFLGTIVGFLIAGAGLPAFGPGRRPRPCGLHRFFDQ